jgi:ubiquinone/menaquinone biosynthesis C-methylase UbiE
MTDALRHVLLDMADLRPGEHVLDIGTGTGAAALLAARRVGTAGRVLGIDRSSAMLAKARAKAARRGFATVAFRRMDCTALRLPRASFDAVISSFGTPEGLYDGEDVFRQWLGVLRPGGRLCFADSPGIIDLRGILNPILEKYQVKDPSPALAAKRKLWKDVRERREHAQTIDGDQPRKVTGLMRAAGFRDVRVILRRSSVRLPSAHTILRLCLEWDIADEYAEMPPRGRTAFRRDLLRGLRPFETPTGLRMPTRTNFFLGRRPERGR